MHEGWITMGDFFRQQLFNIIAMVFLVLFVAVWATVLFQVGLWVPDGKSTAPELNGAVLVLTVWLVKGTASTDLIGAFSLSLLGWIIGAAGVVFQTEKSSSEKYRTG